MRKIVIPGGSGFLGRTLAKHFALAGDEVVILSRNEKQVSSDLAVRTVRWDGNSLDDWCMELEGSDAVVNLAGRSVNCRYHKKNRKQMMDSRVRSTQVLGEAIRRCERPPRAWLQSSTATIYRHRFDFPHCEDGEIGPHRDAKDRFSVEVAKAWERAFTESPTPGTRRILLRTAMVFGNEPGGVYQVLARLARMGLGGPMNGGNQFVSWIHATDFCDIVEHLIDTAEAQGVYNVCAPNPLPNREMMRVLRNSLTASFGVPQPRLLLEIGAFMLRTETELVVKSRYVVPKRLLDEGFSFRYHDWQQAATDLAGLSSPNA